MYFPRLSSQMSFPRHVELKSVSKLFESIYFEQRVTSEKP